jgi:hypothetical protein
MRINSQQQRLTEEFLDAGIGIFLLLDPRIYFWIQESFSSADIDEGERNGRSAAIVSYRVKEAFNLLGFSEHNSDWLSDICGSQYQTGFRLDGSKVELFINDPVPGAGRVAVSFKDWRLARDLTFLFERLSRRNMGQSSDGSA